ncbi:MAG: peptidylprolyl isomerase [Aggregatilineales bacterium]
MRVVTRFIMLIATLLMLILALAACGGDAPPDTTNTNNNNPVPTTDSAANNPENTGMVARVNGEGITQEMFAGAFSPWQDDNSVADKRALRSQILDSLIEQVLLEQAAASLNVSVTADDAGAEITRLKQSVASEDEWNAYLNMNGFTEAELLDAQYDALLTQRVQETLFANLSGNVPQVNARHILVRTEADATLVLDKLRAGESFDALAAQYSIDMTTRDRGGNLGWFTAEELLDERLADVAFSLQPNQVAGPIATRIGYHIIQTMEIAERPIEEDRMALLMRNIYDNWLAQQFESATIERYAGF